MSDQERLRTVVITGATKGLGRALALSFARAGFYVVGLFRSDQLAANTIREEFNAKKLVGRFIELDITREGAAAIWQAMALPDSAEITLINNACAPFEPQPMHLFQWQDFQMGFEVAVKGTLSCSQAVIRSLIKAQKGTIVNVLSTAIEDPVPKGFAPYVSAKTALQGLTRALASEYSQRGVRVFSVSPSFMETSLTKDWDERLKSALRDSTTSVQDPMTVAEAILELVENPNTRGKGENYVLK